MSKIEIITLASAKAMKPAELASGIATQAEIGRVAYRNAAVMLVALTIAVGAEEAGRLVKKAGLSDSNLKNARQLVRVYEALVVPGHVTEKWFNDVLFMDAVSINAALVKRTAKAMADAGVWKKSVKGAVAECDMIAESGLLFAEREAAKAKKADQDAAAKAAVVVTPEVTAPATPEVATPATPEVAAAPVVEEKAAAPAKVEEVAPVVEVAKKPAVSPMAEFGDAMDLAQNLAVRLIAKFGDEVTIETIESRCVALMDAVATAVKAKAKVAKVG